jgi:hypothetical protein
MHPRFTNPRLRYFAPEAPADGGTGGNEPAPTPTDAAAQAAAAAAATAAAAAKPADKGGKADEADWSPSARAEIDKLRRENGDTRINAKNKAAEEATKAAVLALAKVAGIELPDDKPTVESLGAKLAETAGERDAAAGDLGKTKAEVALLRAAWEAGVALPKLKYLRVDLSEDAAYTALDATKSDYGTKLAAVIASHLAKDSSLKQSGTVGGASGAESFGGANGDTAVTKEQFAKMDGVARSALYRSNKPLYDELLAAQ